MTRRMAFFHLCAILLLGGCSSVGVTRVSRVEWVGENIASAATSNRMSRGAQDFLLLRGMDEAWSEEPVAVLESLAIEYRRVRDAATADALAELCLLHARRAPEERRASLYLSAAFYAYASIFDPALERKDSPFDPHVLTACQIYGQACAEFLKSLQRNGVPVDQPFDCPVLGGIARFGAPTSTLILPLSEYGSFLSCFDYAPEGLLTHSRQAGLGAPLIPLRRTPRPSAESTADAKPVNDLVVAKGGMSPATLLIRFGMPPESSGGGVSVPAALEFYDTTKDDTVIVEGREVPLEIDLSTPLAYFIREDSPIARGFYYLFNPGEMRGLQGLYALAPYDPDKIPAVFIHGLMASPRTWVQMCNALLGDPEIRRNYQFWVYAYPTGTPVSYSASRLRKALGKARAKCDPDGRNPNFARMVIVAHSMGGLLAKQMAMDMDGTAVERLLDAKLDDMRLTKAQRKLLEDMYVFKRLPFVSAVIFIAVPHRGSELATWSIARWMSYMIDLPSSLVSKSKAIMRAAMAASGLAEDEATARLRSLRPPTGIDNLDPDNKMLRLLAETPMASDVELHTVVGDLDGPGQWMGTDGVVPYVSAHIPGVSSEAVFQAGHNVHQCPKAIAWVMELLRAHARAPRLKHWD